MSQILSTNTFTTAKWIVSATASDGTHTTIASALTSSASGDTIFIRPGTYTENITLKDGVNLTAFECDSSLNGTGKVIISGTCTMTTAGSVTISGIQLQTNSAALLAVTGSAASIVNLNNCYLNCTNATGITYSSSSSSSSINISNCYGNLVTTGITIYSNTSAGQLYFNNCIINNSGASTTASTGSGSTTFYRSLFYSPFATSTTGIINGTHYEINTSAQNATCITTAGTGIMASTYAKFSSGSASAISVGTGTTFNMYQCSLNSSNTNTFTGAGTANYSMLSYQTTGVSHNVTTEGISPGSAFQVASIQAFTSTGTYTPTSGMKYCQIEVVGGGGGGGGTAATTGAQGAAASGGGGGAYSKGIFTATQIGASQAVTIAAAAAGGIGFNAGANGGTCSVGALITALGGTGGQTSGGGAAFSFSGGAGAGAGAGGSLNLPGGSGGSSCFSVAGNVLLSARGGDSFYLGGAGAVQSGTAASNVTNGNAGANYGGGGGGACAGTNGGAGSAAGTGGAGAKGYVLITEYI